MLHSIQRLRGMRMAVVLVEPRQLSWDMAGPLIADLQTSFQMPVMLVAHDDTSWNNARAVAEFDALPYLLEFLAVHDVDWNEDFYPDPK